MSEQPEILFIPPKKGVTPAADYDRQDIFAATDSNVVRQQLTAAYVQAANSPDPSNQNGAVLVTATEWNTAKPTWTVYSWNHPTRGTDLQEYAERAKTDRKWKYARTEHAERNAIWQMIDIGESTAGSIMYCPWFACEDCARAIVGAGVGMVIGHLPRILEFKRTRGELADPHATDWESTVDEGDRILLDAGVQLVYLTQPLNLDFTILINEKPWRP